MSECEKCMCFKCPRLELPIGTYKEKLRGGCEACKHCKGESFVDKTKGEFCMWRYEYEHPKFRSKAWYE